MDDCICSISVYGQFYIFSRYDSPNFKTRSPVYCQDISSTPNRFKNSKVACPPMPYFVISSLLKIWILNVLQLILIKIQIEMSLIVTIPDIPDDIPTIRGKVIGTGIALLFAYIINFIFQGLATWARKQGEAKQYALKKLLETSQVLYWFGIAVMFSVFPPFYYGTFSTVMAFITLVVLVAMHILAMANDVRVKGKSVWSIFYFIYHFLISLWIIVAMVMAFIWSEKSYNIN